MSDDKSKKVKKLEYQEKLKSYKQKIEQITNSIKTIEKETAKNNNLSNYGKLSIANNYLNIIGIYCTMSDISMELLGIKNEGFLNEGRKLLYKMISLLQEIVGNAIDVPLSETLEKLQTISRLDDRKRLNLFIKIKDAIRNIESRFGTNSKWKWSFVDLEGESAIVIKNMIDFKALQSKRDPRIDGFVERNEMLNLVKNILRDAATRYREKYEMVTPEPSEMKKAIHFLSALFRVHSLFKEPGEAEAVKKNILIWQEKLDGDMKALEEKRKRKAQGLK